MPTLEDCEYTAFISYAHADDVAWFGWISLFRKELERSLAATLRGVKLPPLHLSGDNGPVAGVLGPELRERIDKSFAFIVVVHENYVLSEWCRHELEYFRERFGEAGCRERLYIVALSEPAVQQVAAGDAWRRLLPAGQLWMPFFDEAKRAEPVEIYMGPELVTPRFKELFLRLRQDFVAKLKAAVASPRPPIVTPLSTTAEPPLREPTAATQDVRIYIESNRHELTLWQPLGERMQRRWERISATPGASVSSSLSLRPRGLPVEHIDQYPSLDDADGVVLLWGKKTPEALVAQINKVENKMSPGRDAAPGVVAYLMPPQQTSQDPVPAWGWQVLRFKADSADEIDIVAEESEELEQFLKRVFERRLRRLQRLQREVVT
jgi:hypothetical protein